ncbi:diguanylate cyclase (GGDEF) domain-containing protein [Halomonas shengliensis]|uniref:Diguanylate cyclase (GGDEF) domain-containing protein n=1 Tax=Halomonas shengliensis TaxID=419597 RepID=A0A1H0F0C4_9GAMM|nr:bifunctional diguanylate cyclase/phosphodiesterase [Halomonas shengliensis]SDN88045.1 diguanylate cyclase (GGDEF) domain-containing protein [Halomonas shengliensis]
MADIPSEPTSEPGPAGVALHPAAMARAVGEAEPVAHVLLDAASRILWANLMFGRLLGQQPMPSAGTRLADVLTLTNWLHQGGDLGPEGPWRRVWLSAFGQGSPRPFLMAETCPVGDGLPGARMLSFIGLQAEGEARVPPFADPVTGLPSTWIFEDRLQHAMDRADRLEQGLAVMLIRLDRAGQVLREHGEALVQRLLHQVSRRLAGTLRVEDSITYLGRYRWGVLVEHPVAPESLQAAALRCLEAMEAPFALDAAPLLMTLSIGIVFYPEDGESPAMLLTAAEQALRHAGPDSYAFVDRALKRQLAERAAFREALQEALMAPARHFGLVYQPQWSLAEARCTGVECLVRWRHPRRGWLLPGDFLPEVREMGQMVRLNRWVLEQVIAQRQRCAARACPLARLELSVNVDASLLSQEAFDGRTLDRFLREMNEDLVGIVLEIDGQVLAGLDDSHALMLRRLVRAGVRLVADNLDGDVLALPYLSRLPISGGKVDRGLVATLGTPQADAVLAALAAALEALGIETTAVGVEGATQQAVVERYGVPRIQGHRIAEPMTAKALGGWLATTVSG